jgi:hypothetical protein
MRKIYAPHEPEEEVLSADDAFRDAEQSESICKGWSRDPAPG